MCTTAGPDGIPNRDTVAHEAVWLNPEPFTSKCMGGGAAGKVAVIFGFSVALQPTKSPADSSAITGGSFITSLSGSLFHKFLCLVLQEDARTETYPGETTYLRISCSDE